LLIFSVETNFNHCVACIINNRCSTLNNSTHTNSYIFCSRVCDCHNKPRSVFNCSIHFHFESESFQDWLRKISLSRCFQISTHRRWKGCPEITVKRIRIIFFILYSFLVASSQIQKIIMLLVDQLINFTTKNVNSFSSNPELNAYCFRFVMELI